MAPRSRTSYATPALDKALDIVELLGVRHEALTLSGIAAALGRTRGELFRIVRTLEARGYLLRETGADAYRLTNRLFLTGVGRPETNTLLEVAFPEMRKLARILGSCNLTVPSGDHTVMIARIEEPTAIRLVVPVGHSLPLAESASGRTYLAFLPEAERNTLLRRLGPRIAKALRPELARIRARGFELAPSRNLIGITDVSVPIFEPHGQPGAFLNLPLLRKRQTPQSIDRMLTTIQEAAARITAELTLRRRLIAAAS